MAGLTPAVAGSLQASLTATGARVHARPPLELRGPFPGIGYYLRNATAGIFGGDAYTVDINAGADSTTRITSPSATKIYAGNGRTGSLSIRLHVEPGACLVWGPHATIIQAGARFEQRTTISLDRDASAVLAEVIVLGRLASGERYVFDRLCSSLEVRTESGPTRYSEAYALTPGDDLATAMAGKGVLTSVYLLGFDGIQLDSRLGCLLESESLAGWSELPNGVGLVVRELSENLSRAQDTIEQVMYAVDLPSLKA